jgi:S-adenosylmethionine hydrolase
VPRFHLVTFLSDYGSDDPFAGLCRAVLARGAPHATVVDLTHAIPPQDIRWGAVVLTDCVRWTGAAVHLAVVDPTVGTARRAVMIEAGEAVLVGPDNGVLWPAAVTLGGPAAAHEIRDRTPGPSRTFDGRDVFAPAAAAIANGIPLGELGPPVETGSLARLEMPVAKVTGAALETEVLTVDRYGNLQLAASTADLDAAGAAEGRSLRVNGAPAVRCQSFAAIPSGLVGVLPDAFGHLQVSANRASAAERLGAGPGDAFRIEVSDPSAR